MKISIAIALLLFLSTATHAQFVTLRATHGSQFLADGLYNAELSKTLGAEFYFSKPIEFIPLPINYNLGIDYKYGNFFQDILLVTGISYVTLTPSGFLNAANAESVTYTTSNWLNYLDLNVYNGFQLNDSTTQYKFASEICYNVGYAFGKSFFVHSGFGGRFNYLPGNKETELQNNSVDLILKVGVLWKFKRKFYN